ncbi:MAG: hypothetical protein JXB30_08640 [Anaerolineae bacterium]|nr:hypothetical protein [Anaerolineae bacterium]
MFRPSVPEALILTKYEMLYDSGVAPLAYPFSPKSQREYWEKMFERRVKTSLSLTQLNTLRLRESQTGNRLTIDDGSKRIEIAAGAGEPDREWLFDVLCRYYNLPHEVKKPEPTVDNPSIASALLEKPRRKRTKRNTWQCPYCKTPTRIEAEGGKKWQVCDGCGWSGAVKE